jgi:valyl-tRNA synthetase
MERAANRAARCQAIEKLQRMLDNLQFHERAPPEKVQAMTAALSDLQAQLANIASEIAQPALRLGSRQ